MTDATNTFEIFLVATPGLEATLCEEAQDAGFAGAKLVPGGVAFDGTWPDVWRANLELRGATRVLARITSFRAMHLAQLDKRARKLPWGTFLRPDLPVAVEATCRKSKIYHAGAAAQRVATALREELGVTVVDKADVTVMLRIEDDLATLSLDTSGEALYRRGHKEAVNSAPMRETMAAMFLRQCGYHGIEPVLDPMCGSGTFVIEAAEIASGLQPGRDRHFAFEQLAGFDAAAWQALRQRPPSGTLEFGFFGSDADTGAIDMSRANAARAGLSAMTSFAVADVGELKRPEGPPGLIICNPPYGIRLDDKRALGAVYARLGRALRERFSGWRVGIVTSDKNLAHATGLTFEPAGQPVMHGGLRVNLYRTAPLR